MPTTVIPDEACKYNTIHRYEPPTRPEAKTVLEESGGDDRDLKDVRPEIVTDWDTPVRADGNNVSAEQEASLVTENRIRFELYATILRSQQSLVSQAIIHDR